jgi:hypothetical protein
LECGRRETHIDYVAGTGALHLSLVASFVSRLSIPHPVDQGRAVIRDRTFGHYQLENFSHAKQGTVFDEGRTKESQAAGNIYQRKFVGLEADFSLGISRDMRALGFH